MGVSVMNEANGTNGHIAASSEFHRLERVWSKASHDEAQALLNARLKERKKWQVIIADKDAELAVKDAELAVKDAEIATLDAIIAIKSAIIALENAEFTRQNALHDDL